MGYWIAALLLVAFGFVTGFSIGPPFLLAGLAMLVLGLSWSGTGLYNPPPEAFDLGLRVGIAGGIGAAIVTFVSLTLRRHPGPA